MYPVSVEVSASASECSPLSNATDSIDEPEAVEEVVERETDTIDSGMAEMTAEDLASVDKPSIGDLLSNVRTLALKINLLVRELRRILICVRKIKVMGRRLLKLHNLNELLRSLINDDPLTPWSIEKELLWQNTRTQMIYLCSKIRKDSATDHLLHHHPLHENSVALLATRTCG